MAFSCHPLHAVLLTLRIKNFKWETQSMQSWSFYTTDCTCPNLLHGQISYLQCPISHSRQACDSWAFPMLKYRYDIHRSGRPRYPVTLRARLQCLKHDALCARRVLMLLLSSSRTHSALEWPVRSCPQCLACTCTGQQTSLAATFRPGCHDNSLCRHTAYWHSS